MKYLTLTLLVLGVIASAEMAVAQQRIITLPEQAWGNAPFNSIAVPPDNGGGHGTSP